ncbi:hypothetical protein Q8A64_13895 [Oxalobacteraceae bacterium R-40]|uniref:Uncharacterized protein n=1 Tax=Keguizhuia sedimenti TaxID=3064264 RepID=A0ABU1BU44_9BURK|nr:hypothetical protein [Oxalobacteraceae bacterium R-40]
MPIPWDKVILHGPQVLDAARGLYGKWQTRSKADAIDPNAEIHVQVRELALRLKAVEEGEETQSGIIEKLAEQSQALSTGIAEVKTHVMEFESRSEVWDKMENGVSDQMRHYSAQLEKLEQASAAHSRKLALALYTAFASFAIAITALVIVLIR